MKSVVVLGLVMSGAAAAAPDNPTFTKDVAPILMENCVTCHRPGEIAPMSLLTYEEARPWAKSIRQYVSERKMPPWHATESAGEFANERRLTQNEIATIIHWVDAGALRGAPEDMPPAPEFDEDGWRLGEPDLIVPLKEVEIPADGPDQFHNLPGKVGFKEDKWVTAVEIAPGNRKVVHHVIVFPVKGFDLNPVQDGWLGAWAAGTQPMKFPEGTGRLLAAGSNIIGDMHYHPCGTPEKDLTRVGLHFADEEEIEKQLVNLWVLNERFKIPAGAANHEVRAQYTFLQDAFITAFAPHMHYRGKDFTYTAHYPDGREETLLRVDDYDFNWQTYYRLKERLFVPEGTRVECVAHFDNSKNNPANPDPTIDVTFGDESYDEMMIGFIDYVVADGKMPYTPDELRRHLLVKTYKAYPGEVFAMGSNQEENRPHAKGSPLYLPREGEGSMVLGVNGNTAQCRIYGIKWNGNRATAKVDIPAEMTLGLEVTVKDDKLEGVLVVPDGDRRIPIHGVLATPEVIELDAA